tara:strand:- start:10769 stop:11947 length:1179 start_codon:yes stop_codon:yes gene_type:complete
MIVRIPIHTTGHPSRPTLLDEIEKNPDVIRQRTALPECNHFYFHTINEILNFKDEITKQVLEVRQAGYDLAWYSNATCGLDPELCTELEYFEYQSGSFHEEGYATGVEQWSGKSNGLILPGKTTKRSRLGPIASLQEAGMLQDFTYSLRMVRESADASFIQQQQQVMDYLEKPLEYFLKLERDLDINIDHMQNHGVQHYAGYPYDHSLYEQTGWSLILESNDGFNIKNNIQPGRNESFQTKPMCSEKTFRTIYNCHPFIMIGEFGLHEHLNSLGYKTFEKFYGCELADFWPMPYVSDKYEKLPHVVEQFQQNLVTHKDEVAEMVAHNKQTLINGYNTTKQMLLDTNEYVNYEGNVLNLHNYSWAVVSYRNHNGKEMLPDQTNLPEKYIDHKL